MFGIVVVHQAWKKGVLFNLQFLLRAKDELRLRDTVRPHGKNGGVRVTPGCQFLGCC